MDTIIVIFEQLHPKFSVDLEIPLDISADDLCGALLVSYDVNTKDETDMVLCSKHPSAILEGEQSLRDFGLHDGSILFFQKRNQFVKKQERYSRSSLVYPNFQRSTRIIQQVPQKEIEVLPPKNKAEKNEENVLLTVLPIVGSMAVMVFLRGGFSGGSMVLYSVMLGGVTLLTTLLMRRNKNKQFLDKEDSRKKNYMNYLERKIEEIVSSLQEEIRLRHRIHRPLQESIDALHNFDKGLFDRFPNDLDFLDVRIGTGKQKALTKINITKQEYADTEDVLLDLPAKIKDEYEFLEDTPIVLQLRQDNSVGIVGSKEFQNEILKEITLDLSLRHYGSEVQLYYFVPSKELSKYEWLRWLPHCRGGEGKKRNIIFNEQSSKLYLDEMYRILSAREDRAENTVYDEYAVVFVLDDTYIRTHPVAKYFDCASKLGYTFIFFSEMAEKIPHGCNEIIHLDRDEFMGTLSSYDWSYEPKRFNYANIKDSVVQDLSIRMAPVFVSESNLETSIVKSITLFQLLQIQSEKQLDLEELWKRSDASRSLSVEIGVKSKNEVVYLDIHEKSAGPHGLVAGTTGSGKSEILQSFLINLAIHFNPHDVGFLIIDFKGGGMANQLKGLPHLMGVITNLEGNEVERSLKSIRAELQRRQLLFAKADVNNIDNYIRKYKSSLKQLVPLPHLLIVVDEFAELKAEQPDFMKELISAARIGRSLGVHLILATQKPSGVVDAQIWSNSRFKLCLKVQNKDDSNEMLHTPLAAEIREPGRAYLQVGNNEVFELFQSGYSGAKVQKNTEKKRFSIQEVALDGVRSIKYKTAAEQGEEQKTELDVLVSYISSFCSNKGVEVLNNICLPPLPETIYWADIPAVPVSEKAQFGVYLGLLDDPERQSQAHSLFRINEGNTFLLGAAQTGKTTLLLSVLAGFMANYTADEINIYILDFSNSIPKFLERSNIIGGICYREEEERIENLLIHIENEFDRRRKLFTKHEVGSFQAYQQCKADALPAMLVMVDNVVGFKDIYENTFEKFTLLVKEGPSLGVFFMVSSMQSNVLLSRTMVAFNQRISLYCNDKMEYYNLFDSATLTPSKINGRGIWLIGKRILEFQSPLPYEAGESIAVWADRIAELNPMSSAKAKPIPMIPEVLMFRDLSSQVIEDAPYSVPVGLAYREVKEQHINLLNIPLLNIIGRERSGRTTVVKSLISSLRIRESAVKYHLYIFDDKKRTYRSEEDANDVKTYANTLEDIKITLVKIKMELEKREREISNSNTDENTYLKKQPLLCMIFANSNILEELSNNSEGESLLKFILENARYKSIIVVDSMANKNRYAYSANYMREIVDNQKNAVIIEDLDNLQIYDISMAERREFKKPIRKGDAYLYLGGHLIDKIKMPKLDD